MTDEPAAPTGMGTLTTAPHQNPQTPPWAKDFPTDYKRRDQLTKAEVGRALTDDIVSGSLNRLLPYLMNEDMIRQQVDLARRLSSPVAVPFETKYLSVTGDPGTMPRQAHVEMQANVLASLTAILQKIRLAGFDARRAQLEGMNFRRDFLTEDVPVQDGWSDGFLVFKVSDGRMSMPIVVRCFRSGAIASPMVLWTYDSTTQQTLRQLSHRLWDEGKAPDDAEDIARIFPAGCVAKPEISFLTGGAAAEQYPRDIWQFPIASGGNLVFTFGEGRLLREVKIER